MFGLRIVRTKEQPRPTHSEDGKRLTPAQQLAHMQGERAADDVMSVISGAKIGAWLILLVVVAVSYDDQRSYLAHIGARLLGQLLIPIAFDAATVVCVMVVGTVAMKRSAKITALAVIAFPVGASMYLNWKASPNVAVAVAYVLVVGLIPAIELLRATMGADFSSMMDIEDRLFNAAKTRDKPSFSKPARGMSRDEWEARKRAGYHTMTSAQKAAWTRDRRKRVSRRVELATPVSPAPAGQLRDLTSSEQSRLTKV